MKFFFIPYHTSTYGEIAAYNFVDFRIKRAGCSNYGGLRFLPPGKRQLRIEN
jgi:hypothetical protein